MAIDKLTPRYLNKDSDERLVKNVEMTDALNLRISTEDDGDGIVIKNAYGNVAKSFNIAPASGTSKVVGSVSHEQLGVIIFFIYNSNNSHSIYQYKSSTGSSTRVYQDSVLGFTADSFVKGDIIESNTGDILLFFNDGESDPKKINVTKAIAGNYPSKFTTGTDEEKLLFLTVAKQPPLDPPTYNIVNNSALKENRIFNKVYQFAYKYIYDDGEHSALSPYSSLTSSITQLRDGFITESAKNFYNQINIFVKNSVADVDKIVVYAREGNAGPFFEIEEKTNLHNSNAVTINFTDDKRGSLVSSTEQNKLFDNVPLKADSQGIVEGRLMYAGYTEGYENIDTTSELISNYKHVDNSIAVSLSQSTNYSVLLDYSGLPSTFTEDRVLYLNIVLNADEINLSDSGFADLSVSTDIFFSDEDGKNVDTKSISKIKNGIQSGISPLIIREQINISSGDSKQDLKDAIYALMHNNLFKVKLYPLGDGDSIRVMNASGSSLFTVESGEVKGSLTFKCTSTANAGTLIFNPEYLDVYINSFYENSKKRLIIRSGRIVLDNADPSTDFVMTLTNRTSYFTAPLLKNLDVGKTFKSGSSHKLGIVYYDDRNRSGGVQELGRTYVNSLADRADEDNLKGSASVVMRVSHNPPTWANSWAPVYTGKGLSVSKFIYGIGGGFIPFNENSGVFSTPNKRIYISLNTLFEKDNSYVKAFGSDKSYSYKQGDKMRIISYGSSSLDLNIFKVVGHEILVDDYNTNPILDSSTPDTVNYTTGSFLIIEENQEATGFTYKNLENNDSKWFDDCIIEVYNDNQENKESIYYEIGTKYDVVSGAHEDDRVTTTPSFIITSQNGSNVEGTTTDRIFKGDIITSGSFSITIGNVYKEGNTYYFFAEETTDSTFSIDFGYSGTVTNTDKVIEIIQGDAYMRPRVMFAAPDQISKGRFRKMPGYNGIVRFIDDYSVSDFFNSESSSIGRPIARIDNAKQQKRKASITYSDFYSADSSELNLSSFNLSLANYKDLAIEHGSIKSLVSYNQSLFFIQERRAGVLAVGKNVIQTGSGDNLVTLSTNVLGNERYFTGEYGCGNNPESVAHYNGKIFFADVNSGDLVTVSSNGLTSISGKTMSSFINKKFNAVSNETSHKVIGGIDKDNKEYIVTTPAISGSEDSFTLGYSINNNVFTTFYSFEPESIVSLRGFLHTFKDGYLYEHNETASRNTFYGASAAQSLVEVISKSSPSAVKTYESLSLEGNTAWDTNISTTNQSAVIDDTSYGEKEGFYYAYVHGATTSRNGTDSITTTKSTDEFFGLGIVDSVSTNTITFKNDISSMSFPLGVSSFLYKVNNTQLVALSLTASSISGSNQLTCNANVSGLAQDDVVVLVADSSIEGDQIRDYFAKIKLTKTETTPIELYAVNAVVTDSKAHN